MLGRNVRSKINSINKTQKITKAMELIAATKMKHACNIMNKAQPYTQFTYNIIQNIKKASLEYNHPYFKVKTIKNAGIIIISTDRGLCGGLNTNLFKLALQKIKKYHKNNIKVHVYMIGIKAKNSLIKYPILVLIS